MYEVSKCAPQEALWDLQTAYSRFWRGLSSHPTFKSKRRSPKSFRVAGTVRVGHNFVKIPRLGRIRLKEKRYIPESVHVNSSTISERAGRWFVSIQGEEERSVPYNGGPLVGVDLGINSLATLSDGTKIENPKSLKRFERKLARLQKSASRKMLGSGNRRKANRRVSKCHYRIACIRKDAINKFTTTLARTKSVVVLENLQVSKMVKNHSLAKSLSDASFGEVRRELEYKAVWYGGRTMIAETWFPSTKRCSGCGYVKEDVPLGERVFRCDVCGLVVDRDVNAARNLEWYGREQVAHSSWETLNACPSDEGTAMKQEGTIGIDVHES